jgi:hypothetical protein
MTAMLAGAIVVAAFGLVALAGLALVVALYRVSHQSAAGPNSEASDRADRSPRGHPSHSEAKGG